MRPAIPFLLILGLLLGPVYYGYCLLFSGRTSQTIDMTERASRWVTANGTILRFANGQAYKPVALSLTPDMNRLMLRLNFAFADSNSARSAIELQYQAALSQLDHTVLERPINVPVKRAGTQTIDIGPLEIPYPAEYLFLLEEAGTPEVVPAISLELIEHIETPVKPVVWAGLALLVFAALIALRDAILVVRSSRSH